MSVKVCIKSLLSLLVIAILFVSIFSPMVEASVIYGPNQYRGDWYLGSANKTGCNGSNVSIVNGSGLIVNGSIPHGSLSHVNDNVNPDIVYSGQDAFLVNDNKGSAFGDYKRLMGLYRPDMHFEKDGSIRLNGMKNNDDAGSSLVFKFLGKYVETDNFTISAPHGNYTLYLRNGDGSGKYVKNGTIFYVRLNGKDVFTPLDYSLTNQVLKKKVSVSQNNTLQVFAVGEPGSYMTLWLEDESPDIVITSPWDDSVSNGTILLAGYTADRNVTSLTVRQSNNTTITIPVINGTFSTHLYINYPVELTLSAVDSTGTLRTMSLCLDGDHLPEKVERQLGFDPLNPDSDSMLTMENEAGNGIVDGYEVLGGQNANNTRLPAFIKAEVHADPLKDDSDGDGLSDYFEVLKLGPYADANETDHDGNGVSDALEDPDKDNLTNIEEQTYGTDPLVDDTDSDGLKDGYEVKVSHTNPLVKDSDNDGLTDASELRLGTDPSNQDTNGNGILDGDETYTWMTGNATLGVSVSVTGRGDAGKNLTIYNETTPVFTGIPALVSPVVSIDCDKPFDNATITLTYDSSKVSDPSNVSLYYFNESYGTFLPVASIVDPMNHTVTAITDHFSTYAIFYVPTWNALFTAEMNTCRGGTNLTNVDVMFAIDSSGSMSSSDPNGYRKIAARNFVGALIPGDMAGVVTFSGSASLICPLTGDFNVVNASINTSGAYDGTDIGAGVSTANNELINHGNRSHVWMMILLSDGYGSYNNAYTQQAKANNITIYTVGLGSSVDTALLQSIATATGGQYYAVANASQLPQVYRNISESIEPTDSDADGLSDMLEVTGFRDGLGYIHYTNPYNNDTDGDGLTDGDEAGELTTALDGKTYYNTYSDPSDDDSDGDGLGDFDEISIYGSDPFREDSDGDWIKDGIEANLIGSDPTNGDTDDDGFPDLFEYAYSDLNPSIPGFLPSEVKFDPCAPDMAPEKRALEFSIGALAGEYYAQDHDNLYYLSGWMAVGFVPVVSDVADVRDLFASIILKESGSNIALNGLAVIIDVASDLGYLSLIGAIPGYLASTISTEVEIGIKFLGHHPKFLGDVLSMIFIVAKLDNNIGTQVKAAIQAFDKVGVKGDDFYTYLKGRGVSDTQFVEWSEKLSKDGAQKIVDFLDNGHSIRDVDYVVTNCKNVDSVVEIGEDADQEIRWLDSGYYDPEKQSGYGWNKILGKHWLEGNFKGAFGSSITQEQVKSKIFESMKSSTTVKTLLDNGDKIKYTQIVTNPETKEDWNFVVIVSNRMSGGIGKGNIMTAYAKRL